MPALDERARGSHATRMLRLWRRSGIGLHVCAGLLLCLSGCTEEVTGKPKDRRPATPPASTAAPTEPGSAAYGAEWLQAPRRGPASREVRPPTTPEASPTPATAPSAATSAPDQPHAATQPPAPSTVEQAPAAAPAESAAAGPGSETQPLQLEGRAIQGGLIHAKVDGKVARIDFPRHRAVVGDGGEFLIGFSRNAPATEKLRITLGDGQVIEHLFQVEQRTYETDRVDGLPESEVALDASTRAAVGKADAEIEKVRRAYSQLDCHKEQFSWPVTGKITSRYGQPRVLNGKDGGIHWGVDIAANTGTAVRAPACGKVVYAKTDVPLAGNVVVIDHGRGLTSTFLHLDRISVKVNDDIKHGAVLGTVGMTGRATGPHIDWRMNLFDVRLDPEQVVPAATK